MRKGVWHPIAGDDSLICARAKTNKYDRNAISMFDNGISLSIFHLTHFWTMFPFYTLKTLENRFSGVFRRYKMGAVARNELIGVNWLPNSCSV